MLPRSIRATLIFVLLVGFAAALSADDPDPMPRAGTTVQLPVFGVAIDAAGVLSVKMIPDPGGRLRLARAAAARRVLPGEVFAPSKLRSVSLVRLEQAIAKNAAAGQPPDDMMKNLAGLLRLKYVFFYPDTNDIVIAGPAEGWVDDGSGRIVGVSTGRPVLQLDDMLVALRAFPPGSRNHPFIGCTIDPGPQSLQRLQQFQRTIPKSIPQQQRAFITARIERGIRDSLGMANIRVFGVSDRTHFAQVLIEADYRMKLTAIGLEAPPVKMTTFVSALGAPKNSMLQRWWFTPNYDCVRVTKDLSAMELVGQGVQLQGEDKLIGPNGKLVNSGAKPSKASELYTTAFTRKYPEIADASPVYAQLRIVIDMLVAAAFIRDQDLYGKAGWPMTTLLDENALPVETLANPKQVECAVNVFWKGNRLLSPAGGGVSIQVAEAFLPERVMSDEDGKLARQHDSLKRPAKHQWWWD